MDTAHFCSSHLYLLNWVLLGVQLLGLSSTWLTRRSESWPWHSKIQAFFLVALVLVGIATIVAIGMGPGYWLASGTTLSLMVVGVVCEFDRAAQSEA